MLAKLHRLQKQKDFKKVFKKGKGFRETLLSLKTVKNDLNCSRFGFVVSQKISKKANIRNKVKRKLREIIKTKIKLIKPGNDIVVIALPGLENKNFQEIKEMVNELLKKSGLTKK